MKAVFDFPKKKENRNATKIQNFVITLKDQKYNKLPAVFVESESIDFDSVNWFYSFIAVLQHILGKSTSLQNVHQTVI